MRKKLKILYLNVTSEIGGSTRHINLLLKGLKGFELYYAAPNNGEYFDIFSNNITTFNLDLRKISLLNFIRLFFIIRKHKIDILHSHGRGAGVYSRILGVLLRKKIYHTFHGIHFEKYEKPVVRNIFIFIEDFLARFSTNIFVSNSEKDYCLGNSSLSNFHKRSYVIKNGIELEEFNQEKTNSSKNRMLALANISSLKGVGQLIRTGKQLLNNHYNISLVIAGRKLKEDQSFYRYNKFQIKDYAQIKIIPPQVNVAELFKNADTYISCSKKEGMPLSILEAMASKTLVIASDVPGNNDIIRNGENGILLPVSGFENELQKILRHGINRDSLIEQAYKDVQRYDYRIMCAKYEKIYS